MADTRTKTEKWISRTLRAGVWTSASLMTIGIFLDPFFPGGANPIFPESISWPLTALTFLQTGLLLLILTPFLRVTATLVSFIQEKDWKFVAVSSFVFIMLLIELVLAFS